MTEIDASSASAALRSVAEAGRAASAPHPTPSWYPAARGVLAAVGFGLLYGPWMWRDYNPVVLAAGMVAAVAFVGVHWAAVRPGGVMVWPPTPDTRRRWRREQWLPVPLWLAGWLAAPLFGWAAGAVLSAVLLGAGLCVTSLQSNARIRAGLR